MRRLLASMIVIILLVSTAALGGPSKKLLRGEIMRHAPMGYFGCFVGVSADHYSCLAARRSSGGVKLTVFRAVDLSDGLLAKPVVKDALLPADSLQAVEQPSGEGPTMHLNATLPTIGEIHLVSRASLYTRTTGNEGCPAYTVHYELIGSGPRAVGAVTHDSGTIGGVQVIDLGCNSYFTQATSGVWWMLTI